MTIPKFSGIILAAGNGSRFGQKKQFLNLNGKPVWKWSYNVAKKCLDEVVVPGITMKGGETRQESVRLGLEAITGEYVVIFDAVRPGVTVEQVEKIKKEVVKHNSVSFAVPLRDTVYCDGDYKRIGYVSLQVPQAFNTEMLREAHKKTFIDATDDTILFYLRHKILPKLIEGGTNLYKITYPGDLEIIKAILRKESKI